MERRHPRPVHWKQSLPFTCGPAALGNVLNGLGWRRPTDPVREEVEIWRESTAVVCPGAHPLGLALAARRRGFSARVTIRGPRPWLWHHIRTIHAGALRREYEAIEQELARDCAAAGVRIDWPGRLADRPTPGVLLVSAPERPEGSLDPHWIGILPNALGSWIADPLRASLYRSEAPLHRWWEDSGFEGTRSWVAVSPPSRPPEGRGVGAWPRAGSRTRGVPARIGEPVRMDR